MEVDYVYRCGNGRCGYIFNHQSDIIKEALSECPVCHKQTLVKIIQNKTAQLN